MKWIRAILLSITTVCSHVHANEPGIPHPNRFTLEREEESFLPIIYYFSAPDEVISTYPILIICDGSLSKGNLTSVLFMRQYPTLASKIGPLNVGCLTIEKWGIDGNESNEEEFWQHYTRSQRLNDHLRVIHHLQEHPPIGWNGKILLLGASEGGPLVTDLSILCPNVIASIVWSGAGDWNWADELWQYFEHWKQNSFWIRFYASIPRWLPFSSDIPPTRPEFDALVQEIIANPSPDLWMGGMTYLYHADAFQKAPVDYSKIKTPLLVVAGTEDSIIDSCDQFVQKGLEAGAPITYFRVDGMDHYIRKRPDIIEKSFAWLKLQLSLVGYQNAS